MLNHHLGFQKTTNKMSIGRRLTKKLLRRKILSQLILSCVLGLVVYYVICRNKIVLFSTIILFIMIQLIAYGLGLGEMSSITTQVNNSLFMELDETGINYISNQTFKERIRYAISVLSGKEELTHVNYDEIEKVEIKKVKRVMKIPGSNLATGMETYDYYFQFKDGSKYNLIHTLTLNDEVKKIEDMLRNHVKNLVLE